MKKNLIGHKAGGDQHVHYEAPDSLHSTSFARVLDLISEGEILGLAYGARSIYLNNTPLENADGSKNFQDVTVDFRTGTQSQEYIPGFPDVENEVSVGVELRSTAAWTHAITNLALSAIRLTLAVPQLQKSDTGNGDVGGYKIDYRIELSTDGGAYVTMLNGSFNGKTTTQYQRSTRIDLPAATTGWTIRVTRLTANAFTGAIADTTNIVSYTDVIDAKLRYPMCALVGVQVDAKQFQSVPARSYDMYGRIIQVPTNYDPVARTYTGVWDGTFKPSWTSNPAWIFRDLVLNDRYGLGNRISSAQIDKWALYAIARYCDEYVSDGKGGTEPRFTCNVYLQSAKQAYAVLQDLASVFRGISYWGGGSIIPTADMPSDPVYVYTAANVIDGKFSRVGTSKKTRFSVVLVSWNDPSDFYKAKVEYVEDTEGIKRYGIQQFSMTAFGCTSQGQAQRAGRWALTTSRLETGMISFDVGMDGAIALPGQIIRVADPSRMGRRTGGRVHTASGRVVTLDKAPTINAGDKLTVILPAGTSETHTVVSIAGDAVTVDADWSSVPVAQSVWSVDSNTLAAPTFKVISIVEKTGGMTFTITASQHEPGKYALVDSGTAISSRPQTTIDVSTQAAPAAVTIAAYTVSLNDVQRLSMSVSCAAVAGATGYEGAYKCDSGNWIPIPRQSSPTVDIVDVLAGTYSAKLCAVNAIGVTSVETVSADTAVAKNANPKNSAIILTPSTPAFHVNSAGGNDPTSITFVATLIDIAGAISFSATGGTVTTAGNVATLTYANMSATTAVVTASITVSGVTFTDTCFVTKISDGANGANGANGTNGTNGTNGSPTYTWIKYGTSSTGAGLNDSPVGMTYIGLAYNKSTATESTTAGDYDWALIKGADGSNGTNGTNGIAGTNGTNGTTTYTWIKYADVADGTGLYDTPTSGTLYIGIAVNKTVATESTTKTDYTWSLFKGDQGVPGTNGTNGSNGARGAGQYYATGSSWVDATADAATPGSNVTDDLVTISDGSTFVNTKRWNGSAWVSIGTVVDGGLLVTGSVTAAKVNANGLSIRKADGTLILDAGGAGLKSGFEAPGTLNSAVSIAANGALSGAGGGAVTIGGLGYAGDLNATFGASWSANIAGRPTDSQLLNNQDSIIARPGGGSRVTTNAVEYGALKIRLPNSWTDTMLRFNIEVYEYSSGLTCTIEVGGYNTTTSSGTWLNVSARVISGNVEYPVYFGHDGTKCCVWVSTGSETWAYPQVWITNVRLGYNAYSATTWENGWQISFGGAGVGAINVTASVTDTYPGADWSKSARRPSNLAALSGSEGIQNTLVTINAAGAISGAGGGSVTIGGLGYTGDLNATLGAPAGTLVNGVAVATVTAGAANGTTALAAVNDSTTGLAQRMRLNADNALGGVLSADAVGVPVGLRVGTLVWNAVGARTSGYGFGITPTGMVGYNSSGALTISVNASTGAVAVAGDISGSTGTFGAVVIGSTLTIGTAGSFSSGMTAYLTGAGAWQGFVSGTYKWSVGNSAGAYVAWNGTALVVNGATITGATLTGQISDKPVVTGSFGAGVSGANGSTLSCTMTASTSGGRSGYTYAWTIVKSSIGTGQVILTGSSGSSVTASATGPNNSVVSADVVVRTTDANGATSFDTATITFTFGTPP